MRLHTAADFKDAIVAASKHLGLREILIEKDYWLTYMLWHLSKSENKNRVVFKGGTSLSKAFGLIKRVSEDVDLAVLTQDADGNELSSNQIKLLLKKIEADLAQDPLKPDENHQLVSKGSKFRKTAYTYPRSIGGDFGHVSDRLVLEINSFANPHPFEEQEIASYIAVYLREFDESLVTEYELEPFKVNVLDLTRTFTEKIMGLVRASHQSDAGLNQLRDKIRHLYDVSKLFEQPVVQKLINDHEGFFSLLLQVRKDDQKNQEFQGDWSSQKLSEAIIFREPETTLQELDSTFRGNFQALLFDEETVPPYERMVRQYQAIYEVLKAFDFRSGG